jgi:DNA end-binding protein Ku
VQLIEQIANDEFEPGRYEDEVRARLWASIQQKIEGQEITATFEEAPKAQIVDLMEALKASLGGDERNYAKSAGAKRKPARKSPRGSKSAARKSASR